MSFFEIESELKDRPEFMCEFTVEVTYYFNQPPSMGIAHACDSSDDYYGYTDCEWEWVDWTLFDQDGEEISTGIGEPALQISMTDQQITDYLIETIEAEDY
jgi:hypothetical protein